MNMWHATRAFVAALIVSVTAASGICSAQIASPCTRYPVGSVITQPQDLFSSNGVLSINFTYETQPDASGNTLYCFVTDSGVQSPTLHVHPGDRLMINLK